MSAVLKQKSLIKNPVLQEVARVFFVIVGAIMVAFGLEAFLVPNGFLDGGVTGVSILLSEFIPVPMGVILAVLNIPFIILTFFKLGKKSAMRTTIGVGTLAFTAILLHHMEPLTTNYVLALGYGGLFLGVGIGLALRQGGALDGTEALASIISNKSRFSVEQLILFINIGIFVIAALVKDPQAAMSSALLFYVVVAPIISKVMEGGQELKNVRILTTKPEAIAEAITEHAKHTVTAVARSVYDQDKGFDGLGSTEISFTISRLEEANVSDIVSAIDKDAPIIYTNIAAARGGAYESAKPGH